MNKNFWNKTRKGVPNWVTLGNLFCGCLSISATNENLYFFSILWIFLGLLLDFLDGYLARIMRVESPLGKELDSFSDLVSFGVAPSYLLYQISMKEYGALPGILGFLPFFSWTITLFTAIRLGRYNLGGKENDNQFRGLPSPANALWICSIPFLKINSPEQFKEFFSYPVLFFLFIGVSSVLLVAPLQLFNLKFKDFNWERDKIRVLFLGTILLLSPILYLGPGPIWIFPFILVSYILLSIINKPLNPRS